MTTSQILMPPITIVIDVLILVLLAATVYYAVRLSKQLSVMRDGQEDLEKLINDLSSSVERADAAIKNMKKTAADSGDKLQKQINQGRELFDELELMNEVGNSLAERLQVLAQRGRKSAAGITDDDLDEMADDADVTDNGDEDGPQSRAERELVAALKRARESAGSGK